MTSVNWEMGYLGAPHPHHHGGGHSTWFPQQTYVGITPMMPIVSACPPGTMLDPSGYICNPVKQCKKGMVMTVEGQCVKRAKGDLGQFNPGQILNQLSQVSSMAQSIDPAKIQQNVSDVAKDVEMYAYAQLGLQTVATVATFGLFLMMFYNFLKKNKQGAH